MVRQSKAKQTFSASALSQMDVCERIGTSASGGSVAASSRRTWIEKGRRLVATTLRSTFVSGDPQGPRPLVGYHLDSPTPRGRGAADKALPEATLFKTGELANER